MGKSAAVQAAHDLLESLGAVTCVTWRANHLLVSSSKSGKLQVNGIHKSLHATKTNFSIRVPTHSFSTGINSLAVDNSIALDVCKKRIAHPIDVLCWKLKYLAWKVKKPELSS